MHDDDTLFPGNPPSSEKRPPHRDSDRLGRDSKMASQPDLIDQIFSKFPSESLIDENAAILRVEWLE